MKFKPGKTLDFLAYAQTLPLFDVNRVLTFVFRWADLMEADIQINGIENINISECYKLSSLVADRDESIRLDNELFPVANRMLSDLWVYSELFDSEIQTYYKHQDKGLKADMEQLKRCKSCLNDQNRFKQCGNCSFFTNAPRWLDELYIAKMNQLTI